MTAPSWHQRQLLGDSTGLGTNPGRPDSGTCRPNTSRITHGLALKDEPLSGEPWATPPQTPQHSSHLALIQASLHYTAPPRRDDYPTNPITTIDRTGTPAASGHRARNEATRPDDALTICTDLEFPCAGRVLRRPGLARPPAPQDHDQ